MQTSPEPTPQPQAVTLTIEQATRAFADWEADYRANPDNFYTEAETAAMAIADVSECRAIHFMALLRQQVAPCSTCNGSGKYRAPYSSDFAVCPDCAARPSSQASETTDASPKPSGNKA